MKWYIVMNMEIEMVVIIFELVEIVLQIKVGEVDIGLSCLKVQFFFLICYCLYKDFVVFVVLFDQWIIDDKEIDVKEVFEQYLFLIYNYFDYWDDLFC